MFADSSGLARHVRVVHLKVPRVRKDHDPSAHAAVVCEQCGKRFPRLDRLKRHIKTVHEQQRDFECGVCRKRFASQYHLDRHLLQVHACDVCGELFESGTLRAHMVSAHYCEFCGRCFKADRDLWEHKRTDCHLGGVPGGRKCHECGVTATTAMKMLAHMRSKHP